MLLVAVSNSSAAIGSSVNARQLLQKLSKPSVALMYCCVRLAKVTLNIILANPELIYGDCIAIIGAVEELAQSSRTISLVDEIFEINFFANVNIVKAILPVMRERKNGHIIVITGISESRRPFLRAVLTGYSWPSRNTRPFNLLLITMGHRRILRRMLFQVMSGSPILTILRASPTRSHLSM